MRMLYAGDGALGGPANYLLGILRSLKATTRYLASSATLSPQLLDRPYDAIILSDFPRMQVPLRSQRAIAAQVARGAGLLMIGGWGSFGGPFGGWRGSLIETLLPVRCLARDDRRNFSGGALVTPTRRHPMFRGISHAKPPVICGLNRIQPVAGSAILYTAREIVSQQRSGTYRLRLRPVEHPLLVISGHRHLRTAALATDLAPHWCGGLVDWGARRLRLPVRARLSIEVGDRYVRWVAALIRWLARRDA